MFEPVGSTFMIYQNGRGMDAQLIRLNSFGHNEFELKHIVSALVSHTRVSVVVNSLLGCCADDGTFIYILVHNECVYDWIINSSLC